MTGIARRIHRLVILPLLLSGLLQPVAAAQGTTCARAGSPALEARQFVGPAVDGPRAVPAPHPSGSIPEPGAADAPSAPCGVAAVPSERRVPAPAAAARPRLHGGGPPPARLLVQSVFRPPRPS